MSLTPEIDIPEELKDLSEQPSKTYALDFNTGEIKKSIDGLDAIKQFIIKAIKTARFIHPIYSPDYGCEIDDLIGKGLTEEYLKSEIERVLKEAIIYDERIENVYNFEIKIKSEEVWVNFNVDTIQGKISISEVI